MEKKTYTNPEIVEMQCSVESGIAISGTKLWYQEGGQGDFDTYTVEVDDQWS